MLFDGAPVARDGQIRPDLGRPGHGLESRPTPHNTSFRRPNAMGRTRYRVGAEEAFPAVKGRSEGI